MDTAPARSAAPVARAGVGVTLWRTAIAILAWWGLLDAVDGNLAQLRYFSQCCVPCFSICTFGCADGEVRVEMLASTMSTSRSVECFRANLTHSTDHQSARGWEPLATARLARPASNPRAHRPRALASLWLAFSCC